MGSNPCHNRNTMFQTHLALLLFSKAIRLKFGITHRCLKSEISTRKVMNDHFGKAETLFIPAGGSGRCAMHCGWVSGAPAQKRHEPMQKHIARGRRAP
jgi:hypothetical protein